MEWFPQKNKDAMGRLNTSIELKLLSTLRILGRGCPYDAVVELTDISGTSNVFISLVIIFGPKPVTRGAAPLPQFLTDDFVVTVTFF